VNSGLGISTFLGGKLTMRQVQFSWGKETREATGTFCNHLSFWKQKGTINIYQPMHGISY